MQTIYTWNSWATNYVWGGGSSKTAGRAKVEKSLFWHFFSEGKTFPKNLYRKDVSIIGFHIQYATACKSVAPGQVSKSSLPLLRAEDTVQPLNLKGQGLKTGNKYIFFIYWLILMTNFGDTGPSQSKPKLWARFHLAYNSMASVWNRRLALKYLPLLTYTYVFRNCSHCEFIVISMNVFQPSCRIQHA